ncbi:hypothetical protein [Micromonospora endolithica]|uniref:Acetoacetate decarboxylase n=1 Tax=Micromonospora endolithica TaxID=230091 RepID=A0A3A9ZD80_9ACTN|nr:hypothetical protein [Micromonospora endolithica]RKN45317.1 hypothetical protein D7223_16985 [Micromonospora endolithica]TWJ22990.1 hypothetical protein JD76_03114 [Micromonospora endolithica]
MSSYPRAALRAVAIVLCPLVVAVTVALQSPSASAATRSWSVSTVEQDCYEFNEMLLAPMTELRAAVPARYEIAPFPPSPDLGYLLVSDHQCGRVEVNGHRWPGRHVSTMGLTLLQSRDGVPQEAFFQLWYGTTNLSLVAQAQLLGLKVRPVAATESVEADATGRNRITMSFRGSGLDHRRTALVTEPAATPVTEVQSAPIYAAGRRGEVTMAYQNALRPTSVATVDVTIDAGTRLAEFDLPPTYAGEIQFRRGGWRSSITGS